MAMCGCYEITFNFAETFSPSKDYKFHDNYRSGGLELVIPIVQEKDKIVLQHLLVVNDTMIIKHWRQDWLYQNTDLFTYEKNNSWKYSAKNSEGVRGQWTQKVFQVDDSPRYEGSATWKLKSSIVREELAKTKCPYLQQKLKNQESVSGPFGKIDDLPG